MKMNEIYAYYVANMLAKNVSVSENISNTVSSSNRSFCDPINQITEKSFNHNIAFLESLPSLPKDAALSKLQNKVNTFTRSLTKSRGY